MIRVLWHLQGDSSTELSNLAGFAFCCWNSYKNAPNPVQFAIFYWKNAGGKVLSLANRKSFLTLYSMEGTTKCPDRILFVIAIFLSLKYVFVLFDFCTNGVGQFFQKWHHMISYSFYLISTIKTRMYAKN